MRVRYITKGEYQGSSLTIGNVYIVIAIESDYYRLLGNDNDPCLYDPTHFEIVEYSFPDFWVKEIDEDGALKAMPFSWSRVGFFEDYHDGVPKVITNFWKDCNRLYGLSRDT